MDTTDKKIIDLYTKQNYSSYEIAELLNTYPNKIRRVLHRHGYELKDRSQAQKTALKRGRSKHPTEGQERSEESRIKISSSLCEYWEKMNEEERQRRSEIAKKHWDSLPESKREELRTKAIAAIRNAATEGSKLEKLIKQKLEEDGFHVEMHKTIIPTENLEIDLFLPSIKTIIEVDGPSHFLPIWGEEKLNKQMNADLRKAGVLLSKGYVLIRVKSNGEESLHYRNDLLNKISSHVKQIAGKFPAKEKRFIEVE